MAAVPLTDNLTIQTTIDDDLGTVVDITDDGSPRVRTLYSVVYTDAVLQWSGLADSDVVTLRAWAVTNRSSENSITIDGTAYVGYITGPLSVWWDSYGVRSASLPVRITPDV